MRKKVFALLLMIFFGFFSKINIENVNAFGEGRTENGEAQSSEASDLNAQNKAMDNFYSYLRGLDINKPHVFLYGVYQNRDVLYGAVEEGEKILFNSNVLNRTNLSDPIIGTLSFSELKKADKSNLVINKTKGVAKCDVEKIPNTNSQILDMRGKNCLKVGLLRWNKNYGSDSDRYKIKSGESLPPLDLSVDKDGGQVMVFFMVSTKASNKPVEDFILIKQEKHNFSSNNQKIFDYIGKGELVIKTKLEDGRSLKVGKYDLEITAFQDFKGLGVNFSNVEYKTIYFEVVDSGSTTKIEEEVPFDLPPIDSLNQLGSITVQDLIGRALNVAMGLMGSIALVMFAYGGVLWMTAMGNAENQKKATQIMLWTSLGIMVILGSWVLVDFVFEAFR